MKLFSGLREAGGAAIQADKDGSPYEGYTAVNYLVEKAKAWVVVLGGGVALGLLGYAGYLLVSQENQDG